LLGLGIAELGAALLAPDGSPLVAVGDTVIATLPAALINFGKGVLGTADKPVLIIIIALVSLAVAGLAGWLELRVRLAGIVPVAVLAALALLAIGSGGPESPLAYLPMIIGSVIAYLILRALVAPLRPGRDRLDHAGRRNLLGSTILVATLGAVGTVAGRALSGVTQVATEARKQLRLPAPARPAPPVPAGAELGVPELTPYITPNDSFYRIDTALRVPLIDPAEWSLLVTGMVEREITISFAELLEKPLEEHLVTLACVSNEVGGSLIGNARWLGYPIRDVLAAARPKAGADMVLSRSQDGFTAGTPLEVLTDRNRQSLLAVGMNGEPLPLEHGFPVRMVVPGLYGYVSATKWVVELKVTTFEADMGYWTPLGWSALGPIKIASRIDTPKSAAKAGTVMIAGVAWAQHTGISRVEVKIDNDAWQEARIADVTGPDTWRQWVYEWAASPGTHTITVRATDATGKVQTDQSAPPAPDGATGYHSVSINVS
jgi:DMSO/TMAO reductase YedYZ molybdopterin-dependent catalytic subunit